MLCSCTDSPLQNSSVKDGAQRYMASSNQMSRLDMMANANTISFTVLQSKGLKGVHSIQHFQDLKDHAATSNLRSHTIRCFGQEAIDAAFNGTHPKARNQSLLHLHNKANNSSRSLTMHIQRLNLSEYHLNCWDPFWLISSAYISWWCTENNCPLHIVKDQHFEVLIKVGQPTTYIPSPSTVSQDIKAVFEKSWECIDKILKVS